MGTRWRGMLAPINEPTGDGRRIASGGFTHRPLPLPLKWQRSDTQGHEDSVVIGSLEKIDIDEENNAVWGEGELFDDVSPATNPRLAEDVAEVKLLLAKKVIGPSVDPGSAHGMTVIQGRDDAATDAQFEQEWRRSGEAPATEVLFTDYEIAAATLVPIPAFAQCRPFELLPAAPSALTAAARDSLLAGPPVLPALEPSDFEDPKLAQITPLVREPMPNGWTRVYGHIATHDVCHVGIRDTCTTAPYSDCDYQEFHRYDTTVDETVEFPLPVGRLTAAFGALADACMCCRGNDDHACDRLSLGAAIAHHDLMQVLAYGRVGEDENNNAIWFNGVEAPGLDAAGSALLSRQKVSGDWRPYAGSLELAEVLVLSHRNPGFPLPRVAMQRRRQTALVAAGTVRPVLDADLGHDLDELAATLPALATLRDAFDALGRQVSAAVEQFAYNAHQLRGPDGRWISMGGGRRGRGGPTVKPPSSPAVKPPSTPAVRSAPAAPRSTPAVRSAPAAPRSTPAAPPRSGPVYLNSPEVRAARKKLIDTIDTQGPDRSKWSEKDRQTAAELEDMIRNAVYPPGFDTKPRVGETDDRDRFNESYLDAATQLHAKFVDYEGGEDEIDGEGPLGDIGNAIDDARDMMLSADPAQRDAAIDELRYTVEGYYPNEIDLPERTPDVRAEQDHALPEVNPSKMPGSPAADYAAARAAGVTPLDRSDYNRDVIAAAHKIFESEMGKGNYDDELSRMLTDPTGAARATPGAARDTQVDRLRAYLEAKHRNNRRVKGLPPHVPSPGDATAEELLAAARAARKTNDSPAVAEYIRRIADNVEAAVKAGDLERARRIADVVQRAAAQVGLTAAARTGGWADLPLASDDRTWDADAAKARLAEWAGDDMAKYGRAFLWHDGDPALKGSYKFPIADVIDGELTIVPAGVRAAASYLSRGEIPAAAKQKIRGALDTLMDRIHGDMAFNPSQKRGPNGRWTKGGGVNLPDAPETPGTGGGSKKVPSGHQRIKMSRGEREQAADILDQVGGAANDEADQQAAWDAADALRGDSDTVDLPDVVAEQLLAEADGLDSTIDPDQEDPDLVKAIESILKQLGGRTVTAAAPEGGHSGAMIALRMSEQDAARLCATGGLPMDELHTTMCYLGESDQITPEMRERILADMRELAAGQPGPIPGDGFALNAFNPGTANNRDTAIVMGVGGQELADLHQMASEVWGGWDGEDGTWTVPEQHSPWVPHVTLQYTDDLNAVKTYADRVGPLSYDRLRVAFGNEVTDIPFGPGVADVVEANPNAVEAVIKPTMSAEMCGDCEKMATACVDCAECVAKLAVRADAGVTALRAALAQTELIAALAIVPPCCG